jgi:hypothetical protein
MSNLIIYEFIKYSCARGAQKPEISIFFKMGIRDKNGAVFILLFAFFVMLVASHSYWNLDTEFLESFQFHTPTKCTHTLIYMSTDPQELAYRLEYELDSDGLRTAQDPVRNRTVFTTRPYAAREFVCTYTGERLDKREAERRIAAASKDNFGYILSFENLILGETYRHVTRQSLMSNFHDFGANVASHCLVWTLGRNQRVDAASSTTAGSGQTWTCFPCGIGDNHASYF